MDDTSPTQSPVAGQISKVEVARILEKALAACDAVTDVPWQQKFLVLMALRSFYPDRNVVRLPLYLAPSDRIDVAVLRGILMSLFSTNGIYVQIWAPASSIDLATKFCAIQDLTSAPAGVFYWARQMAYHRSLPGSMIASKRPR